MFDVCGIVLLSELQSRGCRFESQLAQKPWASFLHLCASVTKQYKLVPARFMTRHVCVTVGLVGGAGSPPLGS